MTFYSILKAKATNKETRNKVVFAENVSSDLSEYKYVLFTYSKLYKLVNIYIEEIKKSNLNTPTKKRIVVANESAASVAVIIAMLECGLIPVLIDRKDVFVRRGNLPYIHNVTKIADPEERKISMNSLSSYLERAKNLSNIKEQEREIIITSSGSEGSGPHFNVISEDFLLNSSKQYGENGSTFYCYISPAKISGLLTNLVSPLLHDTKVVMTSQFNFNDISTEYGEGDYEYSSFFEEAETLPFSARNISVLRDILNGTINEKNAEIYDGKICFTIKKHKAYIELNEFLKSTNLYKRVLRKINMPVDSVMLPRDIDKTFKSAMYNIFGTDLEFSNLKHVYLAGGHNTKSSAKLIRRSMYFLKKGAITNLYGATEAGGVISSCPENKLKVCYISVENYQSGEIIYTFDKKRFYSYKNGCVNEVDRTFDDFDFSEYIPVSTGILENVMIDEQLRINFKDISSNEWTTSGDIGLYINNQLYVLGRKSSLVNINGRSYFLNAMEEYFRKILRNDVYCIPDEERNLVKLCIHYNGQGVDDHISYKDSRNYRLYEEALKLISNFKKFRLDLPAIIADERFYKSSISGKVSRKALKEAANDSSYQYQCFIAYNASKRKFIKDFIEAYEYKNCELIPDYEKFQIMIRLKKCAIFPEYDFSYCGFHLVSVNDELGEYIFEVDADFYFYHDAFTYLETNADVSKMGEDKDALFKELLLKYGIDEDIKNELMNCGNFTEAYKPINQKDKIANILRQTLINAIVATLSFMEPTEARKFLESIKVKPITKDPVKAIKY